MENQFEIADGEQPAELLGLHPKLGSPVIGKPSVVF